MSEHPFVLTLREQALRQEAHLAAMGDVPDALGAFVTEMTRRHGSRLRWWHLGAPRWEDHNDTDGGSMLDLRAFGPGWLRGLLIVMYGEEPDHWPAVWSVAEVQRATSWMQGQTPRGVVYAGLADAPRA